ncbi:MAG: hypothetical protein ACE5KM_08160 [Planctomycetaceae bacterium]
MHTSYFGNVKNLPGELAPVSIARGAPRGFQGKSFKALAPTWAMLKLPREEYDEQFDAILAELDAQEVYDELGDDAVLLCWEPPGIWCHRRRVAEWLETELGVSIPEYGFPRDAATPYREMPAAPAKPKRPRRKRSAD